MFPGCKNVLVLDGNMKNRRDICYAKDAGFLHYPGLPGQIKTGCVASPAFKSRFCHLHCALSCSSYSKEEGTCTSTNTLHYYLHIYNVYTCLVHARDRRVFNPGSSGRTSTCGQRNSRIKVLPGCLYFLMCVHVL